MTKVLELKREHEISEDKNKIIITSKFKEEFEKEDLLKVAGQQNMQLSNMKNQINGMKMQLAKVDKEILGIQISNFSSEELKELRGKLDFIEKTKTKENLQNQIQKMEKDLLVVEKDAAEFGRIANIYMKKDKNNDQKKV